MDRFKSHIRKETLVYIMKSSYANIPLLQIILEIEEEISF